MEMIKSIVIITVFLNDQKYIRYQHNYTNNAHRLHPVASCTELKNLLKMLTISHNQNCAEYFPSKYRSRKFLH